MGKGRKLVRKYSSQYHYGSLLFPEQCIYWFRYFEYWKASNVYLFTLRTYHTSVSPNHFTHLAHLQCYRWEQCKEKMVLFMVSLRYIILIRVMLKSLYTKLNFVFNFLWITACRIRKQLYIEKIPRKKKKKNSM